MYWKICSSDTSCRDVKDLSIYLYAESCGDVYCKSYIQNDNLLGYKCHIGNYTSCMNIKAINGEW